MFIPSTVIFLFVQLCDSSNFEIQTEMYQRYVNLINSERFLRSAISSQLDIYDKLSFVLLVFRLNTAGLKRLMFENSILLEKKLSLI